jgi:hypothetical protein
MVIWKFKSSRFIKGMITSAIYYNQVEKLFSVWITNKEGRGMNKLFESPYHSLCKKYRETIHV